MMTLMVDIEKCFLYNVIHTLRSRVDALNQPATLCKVVCLKSKCGSEKSNQTASVDPPPTEGFLFSTTTIDAATIAAYQETHYHVNGLLPFTLRIGIPSTELKKLYKESGANSGTLITACNPYSVLLSDSQNQDHQLRLETELRKRSLIFCEGEGRHPSGEWPAEASYFVLGMSLEAATKLANQFAQNAIVWCDADAIPQLILLR